MQTRTQKNTLVKDLVEKIKDSKAIVFSDYKGISVKDMTAIRRSLREKGIDIKVVKKTLISIALKDAGIELDVRKLEGQIAIAISSEDEVAAAKILAAAAKVNENLKISAGILGKNVISQEDVIALSKLPSKEELLAKLVGTLNAPLGGLVNVLSGNIRNLVNVLKAIGEVK